MPSGFEAFPSLCCEAQEAFSKHSTAGAASDPSVAEEIMPFAAIVKAT
jgi:hypothetical protein